MTFPAALSRTPAIIGSFVAMMAIGASFGLVTPALGGTMLDMQMNAADARAYLATLDPSQRHLHLFATLVQDTAYPLAYGAFLGAIAARAFGNRFAWPAMLAAASDLVENAAQSAALQGAEAALAAKTVLTPLKFGLFMLAALVALAGLLTLLVRLLRR